MSDKIQPGHENSSITDEYAGEQFLSSLNSLVRTIMVHQDNNQLVIDSVKNFIHNTQRFTEKDDTLTIQVINGRFYFQDEKLVIRKKSETLINNMMQFFEKRDLQEINIFSSIKEATTIQIINFARILNQAEQNDNPLEWLIERIKEDFPWVVIEKLPEQDSVEESISSIGQNQETDVSLQERKLQGRKDYSFAVASIKEVGEKLLANKPSGTRKCVRIIQNMADHILQDESIYMGLSTIKVYDDYTYTHSLNVAILCMCLGKHLELPKSTIVKLGFCGLLHDLGKIWLPLDILKKPGKLSDQEFEEIQKHSLNSVRLILKLRASRNRKADILIAPFEHHLKYNLRGYPHVKWQKPISLLGRILTIADVYDALTSVRVYRNYALTPDQALKKMLDGSGIDFDPILLKVFINMLGVYPIGSLLILDNGEMGLVSALSETDEIGRPKIILMIPDNKGGYLSGEEVDLSERDANTGEFLINVMKSVHPSEKGIQPVQFLL